MVHVISAHHFVSQRVVTIDRPLAMTAGPDGILFVATANHSVHILSSSDGSAVKPPFSTVDDAVQICYSSQGDYLAVMETKESRHSAADFSYIRLYRQWAHEARAQPMRARIAARVSPSSAAAQPSLEMIEVPINERATAIACCQTTGNLAVACGTLVTVHQFLWKTHDISKFRFCDLEELLQLEMPFEVQELALCEDTLVCAGLDCLQVLHLNWTPGGSRASSRHASVSLPPLSPPSRAGAASVASLLLDSTDDADGESPPPPPPPVLWDSTHRQSITPPTIGGGCSAGSVVQLPALHRPLRTARDAGPAPRLLPAGGATVAAASLLFWRELDGETLVPGALCVTPFYRRAPAAAESVRPENPLHSSQHRRLAAVSVFFSASHEGRLYQIALPPPAPAYEGRWQAAAARCAVLVDTHTYTSPLQMAARQPQLLHALTNTGIETYTVRDTRRLCQLQEGGGDAGAVCPDPRDTGFLIGIQPFLHVTHLCAAGGRLALAASGAEHCDSATLYLLRCPAASELYQECCRLAVSHGLHAPAMAVALLQEAHMVLRPELLWGDGAEPPDALQRLYRESCASIGHLLLKSASAADWRRAAQWLRLAAASVDSVLAACEQSAGLVSYLLSALCDRSAPALPYQTANQALQLLCDRAPEQLPALVLSAAAPDEYRPEPPLEALLSLLEDGQLSEEAAQQARLAALRLLARSGGDSVSARAEPLLTLLGESVLAEPRPHLLVTAPSGARQRLTELAELLARGRPDVLAAGLAVAAAAGRPPLAQITALLVEAADTTDRAAAQRYQLLLRETLELHLQEAPPAAAVAEAVTLLVRIYLAGLAGAFAPAEGANAADGSEAAVTAARDRQRLGGQCGARATWLNQLEPFAGRTARQSAAGLEADSRLVDLVMLQSLLCSPLPSAADRQHIVQFLDAAPPPQLPGAHSLRVLCCADAGAAAALLVDKYPLTLLDFAKERCADTSDWAAVVAAVSDAVQERSLSAEDATDQQAARAQLLEQLALTQPPATLRSVLGCGDRPPAAHDSRYLRRCKNTQLAELVRAEIIRMA